MKLKIITCYLITIIACIQLQAQVSLTLSDCQKKAHNNYPQIQQYGLLELSEQYNLSNLSKSWIPQISVNAQATYQSDVVHFPINMPGVNIPTIDKDQYKATIDVSQTIWDGGITHAKKSIEQATHHVEKQRVEVDLYTIRERVNQLFFGILTIDEQLKQLDILTENLQTSYRLVSAFLQNGTGIQSDIDIVQVELLSTEQKRVELAALRQAYCEMLSAMIHETINDQTQLIRPEAIAITRPANISRPEMLLFTRQNELLDVQDRLITAGNMPRFSLFAQGGYGKPGLNMLSNEFDFFYLGGIRLNWNFGNLYAVKNNRNAISNQKNMIGIQQETFLFNTNLKLLQAYNEVQKTKELIVRDDEIIQLRHRVKDAAESKYKNGVYTINDLVKDINAENQSRQAKVVHEIQHLMNLYHFAVTAGVDN